ncbi:Crp/Fnr family transcriptional regulator [Flavobacteriaceae bacterium S356]|uniref:Crp/Fnr family transcriptional regulator n=1 Tax=Asprobacillus argus TaxID=3076534 RepID=A0ABU3LFW8_9FLAO|nr:Crp/Fnr family transcriptional regulator [Flavobacteriaceae bacterium S356]
MDTFISYIKTYISLSAEAENTIKELAKAIVFPKGTMLAEEGKTSRHLYYMESGTVRTYLYQKGKDITHWIYPEGGMITSWHSYLLKKPSTEYIEVTEESKLISLSYDDWQELYLKHPELERFVRLMLEEQIAAIDEFYKGYYFLSAKEKYELLIAVFPSITQRANLGHIASMLGITQETLSRIRGK